MIQKHFIKKLQISTTLLFILSLLIIQPSHAFQDDNIALLDRSAKAFSSVVKKAGPAVVYIGVEKSITNQRSMGQGQDPFGMFNDPFFQRFFGPQFQHPNVRPREFKQKAAGSGFIISSDGMILTNNHVVEDADTIKVRLADEREFTAKVIGTDPQSDVALIKIDGHDLPTLPLGNSDKLEVGEWVIAIGSPFELSQTVTVGVVSAKGRSRLGINDYENFIQTDAAINPGNSGGPLLNIHGEAVGINTAIFSRSGGYMGIGFAIPVNMAKNIQKQLQKNGKVTRGWLGVVIQNVNADLAQSFNLDKAEGILISEVADDSPAAKSGLKQGDVILSLNDTPLADVTDLRNKIAMTTPESSIDLQIIRHGHKKTIAVRIGEQPSSFGHPEKQKKARGNDSTLENMGLSLQDLSAELAKQFNYSKGQGVLIAEVAPDSPASRVGLRPGQLIEEVNQIRIHSLSELKKALKNADNPKQILLRIRAGEFSQYVVLHSK
ncbi:MAG: serine protease [Desulfobulbus sp.]|nr:MAG: serine protease [Desulfobulbus sp.]